MQEYWRSILRGLKPEIRDSLTLEKALVNREGTRLMVCFHAPGLIVGDDYNDIKRSVRAAKLNIATIPAVLDDVIVHMEKEAQ